MLSPVVFAVLWFMPAPYGRHRREGFGPEVPGRLGWFLMEWPTVALFGVLGAVTTGAGWVAFALWMLHYARRTLVYPLVAPSVRPMSALVVASGMGFQLVNSTANGLAQAAPRAFEDPWLWAGVLLFLAGQAVNEHGDRVLQRLRAPGETSYSLPTDGLYRWVTNVSYLGEMITWCGWALLTGSLAGMAFAVFTVANLAPRARANARWYNDRFGRQPGRWILLPGVW